MKKTTLLTFTLILGCLSAAQAQVSADPYVRPDGAQVQGDYRSGPDGTPSYLGSVNPYSGGQASADPKLHLERNVGNQRNSGSGGLSQGPVYNPFTIYRH